MDFLTFLLASFGIFACLVIFASSKKDKLILANACREDGLELVYDGEPPPRIVEALAEVYKECDSRWDPSFRDSIRLTRPIADAYQVAEHRDPLWPTIAILLIKFKSPPLTEQLDIAIRRARNPLRGWESLVTHDLANYLKNGIFSHTQKRTFVTMQQAMMHNNE